MEEPDEQIIAAYTSWYEGLEKDKSNGLPDWGPVCTGLIILERLIANYTLDINHHRTANGAQIQGQGISSAKKILKKFDVPIKLTSGEFGRTNRSSVPTAEKLLNTLKSLHLEDKPKEERDFVLIWLQEKLLAILLRYTDHFQIEAQYHSAMSTEKFVRSVLSHGTPKTSGAIAQHLVGAKLELRFPDEEITNHVASAADASTDRSGDFTVGDTVFHVTMAPQDQLFLKCRRNLAAGCRVYLLIPESKLQSTHKKAQLYELEDDIVVKSIESFVGQNIDELGKFSTNLLRQQLRNLIEVYNRRVQVERYAPEIEIAEALPIEDKQPRQWIMNDQVIIEDSKE